jgi:hypothetical protein
LPRIFADVAVNKTVEVVRADELAAVLQEGKMSARKKLQDALAGIRSVLPAENDTGRDDDVGSLSEHVSSFAPSASTVSDTGTFAEQLEADAYKAQNKWFRAALEELEAKLEELEAEIKCLRELGSYHD